MKFEICSGPEDGKKKEIMGGKITIGRGAGNDLAFPYAGMVSMTHAEISREANAFYLMDKGNDGQGSRHGTIIQASSGERIEIQRKKKNQSIPGEKLPITPGDMIVLGDSIWLKFMVD